LKRNKLLKNKDVHRSQSFSKIKGEIPGMKAGSPLFIQLDNN